MNGAKLLKEFFAERNPKFVKADFWDKANKIKREYNSYSKERGPFNLHDLIAWKSDFPCKYSFVPEKFYNKRIKLTDELSIIVQYEVEEPKRTDNYGDKFSGGYRRESYTKSKYLNITACYRGLYLEIAKYKEYYCVVADNYKDGLKLGVMKRFGKDTPYYVRETEFNMDYEYYDKIGAIIKSIENLDLEITDCDIDHQCWYDWYNKELNRKSLHEYSSEQIDWEYFIGQDIKDGVFKPEKSTIDNLLNSYNAPKDLLKKMGVHTVRLRSNCHFAVHDAFDLKGIELKAPKSVIQGYHDMDKFCEDKELLQNIKEEEAQNVRDRELADYNNKFTLMQHGKVLMENADRYKVSQFLENHQVKDIDEQIAKSVKPIFDHFKGVKKIFLARWGYHWEAELRGERCSLDEDVSDINSYHLNDETMREVYELFHHCLDCVPSEEALEIKYGWPELTYCALGVKRGARGKLEVFVEEYREAHELADNIPA